MSTLKIYDKKGSTVGDYAVADDQLKGKRARQAVQDVLVAFQAGQRAGTASTLGKGAVAGSNRKPWRQKGTGNARAGFRRSPIWRGGGVAHGPHPRSYEKKVNRKVQQLAFATVLRDKIVTDRIMVMESLDVVQPKTREVAALLKALKLTKGVLLVVGKVDRNLRLACRNLPGVEAVTADAVNVYQMMRYPVILTDRAGMEKLTARLASEAA